MRSRSRQPATAVTSLLVLGAGLAGLFLGVDNWWLIFVLGYAVLVPIVSILSGEDDDDMLGETEARMDDAVRGTLDGNERHESSDSTASKQDALETLRERYARGELSDEQFEAKLETLLDTETLENARARVDRGGGRDRGAETDRARDSDANREYE
jgi:hypothetical protein